MRIWKRFLKLEEGVGKVDHFLSLRERVDTNMISIFRLREAEELNTELRSKLEGTIKLLEWRIRSLEARLDTDNEV